MKKKKKNCTRHWILKQHEKLDSNTFEFIFSFGANHLDYNDPRLKGRNCGFL